jgi:hypothetical protein
MVTPPASASGKPFEDRTLAEVLENPVPAGFTATRPGVVVGGPELPGPVLRRLPTTCPHAVSDLPLP